MGIFSTLDLRLQAKLYIYASDFIAIDWNAVEHAGDLATQVTNWFIVYTALTLCLAAVCALLAISILDLAHQPTVSVGIKDIAAIIGCCVIRHPAFTFDRAVYLIEGTVLAVTTVEHFTDQLKSDLCKLRKLATMRGDINLILRITLIIDTLEDIKNHVTIHWRMAHKLARFCIHDHFMPCWRMIYKSARPYLEAVISTMLAAAMAASSIFLLYKLCLLSAAIGIILHSMYCLDLQPARKRLREASHFHALVPDVPCEIVIPFLAVSRIFALATGLPWMYITDSIVDAICIGLVLCRSIYYFAPLRGIKKSHTERKVNPEELPAVILMMGSVGIFFIGRYGRGLIPF